MSSQREIKPLVNQDAPNAFWAELVAPADLKSVETPWRDLMTDLETPNPFFAPWTLIPALETFADDDVRLACAWADSSKQRLLGLAPLCIKRTYARLPVVHWETWLHPHCFYGAPLIRKGHAECVFEQIAQAACDGEAGKAFVRHRHLGAVNLEQKVLEAGRSAGRFAYDVGAYERAALYEGEEPEQYLAGAIRKKKRKELNRLRNRLNDIGEVKFHQLTDKEKLPEWIGDFLALEEKGWKGETGTALNSSPGSAAWFQRTITGAFENNDLKFYRLICAGRTIAMQVILGRGQEYALKICHDPAFDQFSPGVMINLEITRKALSDPSFSMIDSCASRDHPMINSIWRARREITGVNVSGVSPFSKSVLRLCALLERLRAALKSVATKRQASS